MHRVLAGLFAFLVVACSSGPTNTQSSDASKGSAVPASPSDSEKEVTDAPPPSPVSEPTNPPDNTSPKSTATSTPSASTSSAPAKRVPPPHEKWMDMMMSLSGVEPPNQAKMLEEDPIPINLRSVEILIAQRYKPEKPIALTIRAYVTESGTVGRVQVLRNSQPDMVPSYFLPPLRELRFHPAKENGKPISAWATFTLDIRPI
ncbi:MAG: hypothetical protein NZ580_03835 [Bacteroidia bacterium]|nr:hypothetical protein [Bacteroidia bacterium]MDW8235459.1 hypothetical protein [Bacteroidia bacterium]